jgi:hypothetical protein
VIEEEEREGEGRGMTYEFRMECLFSIRMG